MWPSVNRHRERSPRAESPTLSTCVDGLINFVERIAAGDDLIERKLPSRTRKKLHRGVQVARGVVVQADQANQARGDAV